MGGSGIGAFLFDKDGTLLDFQKTWGPWSAARVRDIAAAAGADAQALADHLGVDLARGAVAPYSVIVAGTLTEVAEAFAAFPGAGSPDDMAEILGSSALLTRPEPVCALDPLFAELAAHGCRLGVATNDGEAIARSQMQALGVLPRLEFVAGFDSGWGGKPGPGMCTAFAAAMGLAPGRIAMVGDSLHDLEAGRAAGMVTIAVETGPASAAELAPHADHVLPSIADLPVWLAG